MPRCGPAISPMSTFELMPIIEVEDPIPMVIVVAVALIDTDGRVLMRRPSGKKWQVLEFLEVKLSKANTESALIRNSEKN